MMNLNQKLIEEFLLNGYDAGTHNEPKNKEFEELNKVLFNL
jgi:hypothetical protein